MIEDADAVPADDDGADARDERLLVAALMVFVARGDGTISDRETEQMLSLLGEYFGLTSGASLALLTRAMEMRSDDAAVLDDLRRAGSLLAPAQKEDVAVMLLKLVAADGRKDASEMDLLRRAGDLLGIGSEGMHRAFDRYFSETWS